MIGLRININIHVMAKRRREESRENENMQTRSVLNNQSSTKRKIS